jgi:hypothetical protein
MATKKYIVTLDPEERQQLDRLVRSGRRSARAITRARILLLADQAENGPARDDARIAEALRCGVRTVERVRQRLVERGPEAALEHRPQERPSRQPALDGEAEARLIALACSAPPDGRKAWTLRLLAGRLVELEIVPAVSRDTVRRALKKTSCARTGRSSGSSRPTRAASSSPAWRTCWSCTAGRTASGGRRCASTSCPSN